MENENTQVLDAFKKILVVHQERDHLAEKIGFANTWLEKDQDSCISGLKQMIDELVGEASFLYTTNRGADAFYLEKLCLAKTIVNDWGYLYKDLPNRLDFFAQASDFLLNIFSRTQICDLTKLEIRVNPNQEVVQYDAIQAAQESLEKITKVCDFNQKILAYDEIFCQKLKDISEQCQFKRDRIDEYVKIKLETLGIDSKENVSFGEEMFQKDLMMLKELKNYAFLNEDQKAVFIQELEAELTFHLENLELGIKAMGHLSASNLGSITDFLACVLDYLFYLKDTDLEIQSLKNWLTKLKVHLDPNTFFSIEDMLKTNEQQQIYVEEIELLLLLNNLESLTNVMPIFMDFEQIADALDPFYHHFAQIGEIALSKLKANEILVLRNFPDETGSAPNTFGSYADFMGDDSEQANESEEHEENLESKKEELPN